MKSHPTGKKVTQSYNFERLIFNLKICRFVPRQRWLHNIEHGSVVMLYHPCTLDASVQKLAKILKSCIKKHIITPSTFVTRERVRMKGFKFYLEKNELGKFFVCVHM
jgi:hypothetical protein